MRVVLFLLAALCAVCGAAGADLPSYVPQKRGDFAFCYVRQYSPEQMKWFTRFNVVCPGDYLPAEQVRQFRAAGSKLVRYEWSVAFGVSENYPKDAWQRWVLAEHPDWLINTKGLFGYAGPSDQPAYYYDVSNPDFRRWWVERLVREAKEHDYQGFFFDTTTFDSVHPDAQAMFRAKHPGVDYNECARMFFAELRKAAPNVIIFPNQGYRDHVHFLPDADYDLSESYMTTGGGPTAEVYVEGKGMTKVTETLVHRWYHPGHLWWSVCYFCDVLIDRPHAEHGYRAKMCHLNYGQPRYEPTGKTVEVNGKQETVFRPNPVDREAMYYAMAGALLMGQTSYYSVDDVLPVDDVYFVDMGKPLGNTYFHDRTRGLVWRLYENGIVAANDGDSDAAISFTPAQIPRDVKGLYDVYTGRDVKGFADSLTVHVPISRYVATSRTASSGRIFVYIR